MNHDTEPLTGQRLRSKTLAPNFVLRGCMEELAALEAAFEAVASGAAPAADRPVPARATGAEARELESLRREVAALRLQAAAAADAAASAPPLPHGWDSASFTAAAAARPAPPPPRSPRLHAPAPADAPRGLPAAVPGSSPGGCHRYRATRAVGSQHRVRRGPSLEHGACACLEPSSDLYISEERGGWGKLHPRMLPELRRSPGFVPFDIHAEGWTLLADDGARYWAPSPTGGAAEAAAAAPWTVYASVERNIGALGHRVRLAPSMGSRPVAMLGANDVLKLVEVRGGWGKLHSSMAAVVREAAPGLNLAVDGWTLLCDAERNYWVPM
jgi:hypothetical protein